MRNIDSLIVHCSATPPEMDIGVYEIRRWHVEDNGWDDVGYHFVIRRDGAIEDGRRIQYEGAHTRGANANSIGVCLVGGQKECDFTLDQYESLANLIAQLAVRFPGIKVLGHRDAVQTTKQCPQFNATTFAQPVLDQIVPMN